MHAKLFIGWGCTLTLPTFGPFLMAWTFVSEPKNYLLTRFTTKRPYEEFRCGLYRLASAAVLNPSRKLQLGVLLRPRTAHTSLPNLPCVKARNRQWPFILLAASWPLRCPTLVIRPLSIVRSLLVGITFRNKGKVPSYRSFALHR